jgi:pyridoxamine 5'-phosphate oxidase
LALMDETLAATLASAWTLLANAAADPRHSARVIQLATRGPNGAPRLRSVILRGADQATRTLSAYTDRRSGKVAEIAAEPRVAVLAWDAQARIQIRLAGRAELLLAGPAWQAAWDTVAETARRDYAQAGAPGTPCAAPPDEPAHPDPARHFAVLTVMVETLDWLRLAPEPHRRAGFVLDGDAPRGTWLVP